VAIMTVNEIICDLNVMHKLNKFSLRDFQVR